MPRRPSLGFWSLLLVGMALLPHSAALAQDEQTVKEFENSKFSAFGVINANAVYIRCGPGDNYYPTLKLDKGTKVKVVGAKFEWLKIAPPEGSFCYVAKLYVDRHGNGTVGRVNKDSINVRAGSALSALKIGILCEMKQGEEVQILGEEQEYLKVKPPANAYLYINKKYVDPDPASTPEVQTARNDAAKPTPIKPEPIKPEPVKPEVAKVPDNTGATEVPATRPTTPKTGTETVAQVDPAKTNEATTPGTETTPATRPSTPEEVTQADPSKPGFKPLDAEALFVKAEDAFESAKALPLDKQPIEAIIKDYQTLAASESLPESMRRIVDSRLSALKARQTSLAAYLKSREVEEAAKTRHLVLKAEQEELEKRVAEKSVQVFIAVGSLQASSLQQGQGTLYRITDPKTGYTLCYVRSNDIKTASHVGQFVGVRGTLQQDQRLQAKVILPTEILPVDSTKVYQSVAAQIVPPSLIPKSSTASTNDQP